MMRKFIFNLFIVLSIMGISFAKCTGRGKSPMANFGKKAMPIVSTGIAFLKEDYRAGLLNLAVGSLFYSSNTLENTINKKRPCGCRGGFPSGHMIMMTSGAAFMYHRYGLEYGLPAYAASFILISDRVKRKAHGWDDIIGTAALVHLLMYPVLKGAEHINLIPTFERTSKLTKVGFIFRF